jgi:hypothetical protein
MKRTLSAKTGQTGSAKIHYSQVKVITAYQTMKARGSFCHDRKIFTAARIFTGTFDIDVPPDTLYYIGNSAASTYNKFDFEMKTTHTQFNMVDFRLSDGSDCPNMPGCRTAATACAIRPLTPVPTGNCTYIS